MERRASGLTARVSERSGLGSRETQTIESTPSRAAGPNPPPAAAHAGSTVRILIYPRPSPGADPDTDDALSISSAANCFQSRGAVANRCIRDPGEKVELLSEAGDVWPRPEPVLLVCRPEGPRPVSLLARHSKVMAATGRSSQNVVAQNSPLVSN